MPLFPLVLTGLLAAVTAVQVLFWRGVFARLARYVPPAMPETASLPPLSVVICARNEAVNLQKHLPAVLTQLYPRFEVLVVDDDSADDTPAVLARYGAQYPALRVLRITPKKAPGKKAALSAGIAAAQYEHLVLTDADCWPASPQWLRHLAKAFSQKTIVLGIAPFQKEPGFLNRWVRFEAVQTAMQYSAFALAGQPYMGVGRNLAWHRTVFRQAGGFGAHAQVLSGDDDLLVNAVADASNTALCLEPEAFALSRGADGWETWLRQKRRQLGAGLYYRREHRLALGALALSHVAHYFLLIALSIAGFGTISAVFYAFRMVSAFGLFRKILRQFREEPLLIWFPLLDALLAFYYAALVPLFLIWPKRLISWK